MGNKICCCTGHLTNPGGVCCMDLLKHPYKNHYQYGNVPVTVPYIQKPISTSNDYKKEIYDLIKIKEPVEKPSDKKQPPNIFEFIAVDAERRDDMRKVKEHLYNLYCWILDNVEENQYRTKGIGLLEDAAMQLNKAISRRKGDGT